METNILKDMLSKHPEDLTGESLKLFNAIMSIADERDEFKKEIEILRENAKHNDKVVDDIRYENMQLKRRLLEYSGSVKPLPNFHDYYEVIPKQKIKDKIEEYKKMYESLSKNPKEHLHSKTEYLIVIGVLKELLEED